MIALRYCWLALKYSLAALGGWLLLMELGHRMSIDYWQQTLTPR